MHSVIIEERACPRCGQRRTGRFWRSRQSFCFHCRSRWESAEAASPFGAPERARLQQA